jgi:dTDP-4-dehydrorhamnose 3,5-epimerase
MNITKTAIEGLLLINPRVFEDERGYFYETFNAPTLKGLGLELDFLQDNQSFSTKGVLRGLHFQREPHAQGKLVRVVSGKVLDVAVDLRSGSPTFGQHLTFELSGENKTMLYVPPGFAHGFSTLEDAVFIYKCTDVYNKQSEGGIRYDDADLNIDWGIANPIVSEKDLELPSFKDFCESIS